MDDLEQFYRAALPATIDALETARRSLQAGDQAALESIRRIAHTLKGSGGTYGFHNISAAAELLQHTGAENITQNLDNLIGILREVASGGV